MWTMGATFAAFFKFSLIAFTSIFFLVDPFAVIPAFLTMTADEDQPSRRHAARRAAFTCFVVLTVFALTGSLVFKVFGITLPAFKIAGVIILCSSASTCCKHAGRPPMRSRASRRRPPKKRT
jgi:multiple antibiotic resistance protein